MKKKSVKAIYRAGYTNYGGLDTYRVMPTQNVPFDALEPFIFLNRHGPQEYPPNNKGLPFGPHPHKGFETVTFIIEGDLVHRDSTGYTSNIKAGGIQWMTAGKGIIHSEQSSEEFKTKGGKVELLQLWLNLPSYLKNSDPAYIGLQKQDIPELKLEGGKVIVNLVSGSWETYGALIQSLSNVHLSTILMKEDSSMNIKVSPGRSVLFYIIKGKVMVNSNEATLHDLVEFDTTGESIEVTAVEDTLLLFGHAQPNGEPIVAHGPFVMNTQEEIRQAFLEFQQGKLGTIQ